MGYMRCCLKSRIYIDLTPDSQNYEASYEQLLRNIYEMPTHRKPALGKKPEWLENESTDLSAVRHLIKQLKNDNNSNPMKTEFTLKKTQSEIIAAIRSYTIPNDGDEQDKSFMKALEQTKDIRDLYLDYIDSLIVTVSDVSTSLTDFFENLYNELDSNSVILAPIDYLYRYLIHSQFA